MSLSGSENCKPLLLSVEAIIGAGKSTLLEALDSRKDIVVVREPVDLWTKQRGGETLLSRYYGDQESNAFMFETYAMMSRVQALQDAKTLVGPETRAIVMERSWLSSRHCFAENSKELGHLDELEFSLYDDLFRWGEKSWPKLDGVLFIDSTVTVAQQRVAIRGRTAESGIPFDYQAALLKKHHAWLKGQGSTAFDGPVLTLDGNMDKDSGAIDIMVTQTLEFVDEIFAQKALGRGAIGYNQNKENLGDSSQPSSEEGYHTPVKAPRLASVLAQSENAPFRN